MKSFLAITLLISTAFAADTCIADPGCTGCEPITNAAFVTSGNKQVASASPWAVMSVSGSTVTLENESDIALSICDFRTVCYKIAAHSECTGPLPQYFDFEDGLTIWGDIE